MTTDMLQGPSAAQPRATGLAAPSSWLVHEARLTRWEVTLLWRRRLTVVLGIILVVAYVLALVGILLVNNAAGSAGSDNPITGYLSLPGSLLPAGILASRLLPLLMCILAGAYVGGEFGFSTLRLVLMRGTSRLQLVLAQAATLAFYALAAVVLMGVLGLLSGAILGRLLGYTGTTAGDVVGEVVRYGLAMAFSFFLYGLIALFFAVLGRSVAAGVGISLGVLFLENLVVTIFHAVGMISTSGLATVLNHAPRYFPILNTTALMDAAGTSPLPFNILDLGNAYTASVNAVQVPGLPTDTSLVISGTHAIIVMVVYCVLLLGGSYLLLRQRDVKE